MPTTFDECDPPVYAMLSRLIETHRQDLRAARARITLLFASSSKPGIPAMKRRGSRILGRCKINSLQDRIEGKGDVTIALDREAWDEASERQNEALLFHELSYIDRCEGETDDFDRPVLRSRPGDWENDGFDEVVRIYGADAPERRWLDTVEAGLARVLQQSRLPFGGKEVSDEDEDPDGGISSITLTAYEGGEPSQSVTLTPKAFDAATKALASGIKVGRVFDGTESQEEIVGAIGDAMDAVR